MTIIRTARDDWQVKRLSLSVFFKNTNTKGD